MDILIPIVVLLIGCLGLYIGKKSSILQKAKSNGILIKGRHYKVYMLYRCSSYTDGGVYRKHHEPKYFNEVMLVSPEGERLFISESHLKYCLKVRNHKKCRKAVDGKMTSRWSEWEIDSNGNDVDYGENDIYTWLY